MERKYVEQLILVLFVTLFLLGGGTLLFNTLEGWGLVDSLYFTGITLTAVGYGDFVPTTTASKLFSVLFSFVGIGIVLYGVTLLARLVFESEQEHLETLLQRRVQKRLSEEQKTRESLEKEAEDRAKAVEKEAVKMVKEIAEEQRPKASKKGKK